MKNTNFTSQPSVILTVVLLAFNTFTLSGQRSLQEGSRNNREISKSAHSFFPEEDLMKIGVFYYPEQWPREEWERDFKNMAGLGFEFTHLAEFSWTYLEPEEGRFDFKWLDEAIDLASRSGLKVILCTPTLCPPAWMGEKYPEIYLIGGDGRRREHGIRADASITNPKYRFFTSRIITEMAKHYGNDKRIWGWQVDNEPLAVPDYSPSARDAFREWLKKKYSDINSLNAVWAGSFWSTRHDNFGQILIPNESMNSEDKLSPHALLDFERFTADMTGEFLNEQADILRKYILPDQWITTNYINASISADPRRSDHLDFPSFTMYPVSGRNELGGNNFRTGIPYRIYEACDYYRSITGITGLMELQPGQVNWADVNPLPEPGTIHMWILQAFGGRCSFLCTYRYRHPLRGSEMYHDGIVGTDGVTLTQGGTEFVQAIREMKQLKKSFNPESIMPEEISRRRTAILWSHDVMWDLDIQKQSTLWNTWRNRNNYSSAVKSTGAPLDFISEKDDFSKYPFLIAPSYQLVDSVLVKKWFSYVEKGGNLILTCRTGQKDKNGHFFEGPFYSPIRSLIGADIDLFDMLPPDSKGRIQTPNSSYEWNIWADIMTPYPGTDVLATYSDQFYSGKAAAITRKLGKGTVTFIGVATQDGNFERAMIRNVYRLAGVSVEDLPKGVYHEWRSGFNIAVNYTDDTYEFHMKNNARILIGENPVKPARALVWKEN